LNEKHKQNTKLDENRGVNFNKQFQQLFGANVLLQILSNHSLALKFFLQKNISTKAARKMFVILITADIHYTLVLTTEHHLYEHTI